MKLKFWGVVLILVLVVAAFFAVMMIEDKGYVLFNWGDTVVEMNFVVAAGLILFTFLALYILKCVLMLLTGVPVRRWWSKRKEESVKDSIAKGIASLNEGKSSKASKLFQKAASKSDSSALIYTFASQAAEADGDSYQADALLEEAADDESFINLAKYEHGKHLIARGQYKEALTVLEPLKSTKVFGALLNSQLETVYERLEKWPQLVKLFAERKEVSDEMAKVEQSAWINYLRYIAANASGSDAAHQLSQAWSTALKRVKQSAPVISEYAVLQQGAGDSSAALSVVESQLKRDWNEPLIESYGLIEGKAEKQLAQVESWLEEKPVNAAVYLTAGRLAKRAGDTNKAEGYFEMAQDLDSKQASFCLAELKLAQNDSEASLTELKKFFSV